MLQTNGDKGFGRKVIRKECRLNALNQCLEMIDPEASLKIVELQGLEH